MSEQVYSVWMGVPDQLRRVAEKCDSAIVVMHELGAPPDQWKVIGSKKEAPDLLSLVAALYDQLSRQGVELPPRVWGPGIVPMSSAEQKKIVLSLKDPQTVQALQQALPQFKFSL